MEPGILPLRCWQVLAGRSSSFQSSSRGCTVLEADLKTCPASSDQYCFALPKRSASSYHWEACVLRHQPVLSGLLMFVINVLAGVWIKYNPYSSVSIASSACIGLAFVYLVLLYLRWTPYLTGYTKPARNSAVKVRTQCPCPSPYEQYKLNYSHF